MVAAERQGLVLKIDISSLRHQIEKLYELLVPAVFNCLDDFIDCFIKVFTEIRIFDFRKTITADKTLIVRARVLIDLNTARSAMRTAKSNIHN
ncbi:hypothetical protein GQG71_004926 [Salmonella enterica]|nr:hypothetical protein [Salmonella enterica]EDI8720292.1 hypothetical protein [Salmonella enterica]EEF6843681.1 hypothetical protein [Salmonella enterica]EIW5895211.1 hypothetical protein [Salmonella enterica]EKK2412347.1 hypothetical protein [Salmonella enterica]